MVFYHQMFLVSFDIWVGVDYDVFIKGKLVIILHIGLQKQRHGGKDMRYIPTNAGKKKHV